MAASLLMLGQVGCGLEDRRNGGEELLFDPSDQRGARVVVDGLTRAQLVALRGLPEEELSRRLTLRTVEAVARAELPPLAGEVGLEGDRVFLRPSFGLVPGQRYLARWLAPWAGEAAPLELAISLPRSSGEPVARVVAVYPSAERLPANLLRVYIHFNRPMREGEAARHVWLERADGSTVEAPFATPHRELWSPAADRLTLLFDPGRVKREVGPNRELGPPLEIGRKYRLVVDGAWPDAGGEPLESGFEKPFEVVVADREGPNFEAWAVEVPATPEAPLRVRFEAPLDRALLDWTLTVLDDRGQPVVGSPQIHAAETAWTLRPTSPWQLGGYRLVVDPRLEDPSGNSLRGPFDAHLGSHPGGDEQDAASFSRSFEIVSWESAPARPAGTAGDS